MKSLDEELYQKLEKRKKQDSFRRLDVQEGLIDFCSNDYLGFARSASIRQRIIEWSQQKPSFIGSTGSRLISGNSFLAENLEKKIASFNHAEAALLFNSGYDANIGLLSCLLTRHDTYIYDELVHASIRDGIQLSNAAAFSFRHNDLEDLKRKLSRAKGQKVVVLESVYSMDGDISPLQEIVKVADTFDAKIILDEAHGLGVIGKKGEGLAVHLKLEKAIFARIYTFGKAMGSHGAVVVGSPILKDYLINFARSFIYTTALSPHSLWSIRATYKELGNTQAIQQLHRNIAFFKEQLNSKVKEQFLPSDSAIQCLMIPDNQKVKALAQELQQNGFFVKAILHPTVAKGNERIRICIHAFNTEEEIKALCHFLNQISVS